MKLKSVDWRTKITEVEEKNDGIQWLAEISGTEDDRDEQSVNQETLKAAWDAIYRHNPIVVYMHSWLGSVGKAKGFEYDSANGRSLLEIKLGYDYEIPTIWGMNINVDDIGKQVVQGNIRSHSIGFSAEAVDRSKDGLSEELMVKDWFETSIVTIPSYRRGQIVEAMAKGFSFSSMVMQDGGNLILPDDPGALGLALNRKAVDPRKDIFEVEDEDANDDALKAGLVDLSELLKTGDKFAKHDKDFNDDERALIIDINGRL